MIMFKRILFLTLFYISAIYAKNYIDIYRHNGIKEVKKLFDEELQTKSYWESYLKDYNTTYGYFEKEKYIIIADKKSKKLNLFHTDGKGDLQKLFAKDIITGKSGEKKKEGDLITPLGAYKIVQRFIPKDTFYGPIAFAISYPNTFDELNGRDGHGIWIHGYPLDHEKRPPVTKGCMVLKNNQLLDLNSTIDPKNSFVIIHENNLKPVTKDMISSILAFLYQWKNAWQKNDIEKYLSFYSSDFKRYNNQNLSAFSNEKRRIFSRGDKKSIIFKYISILPYPNLKNEPIYKLFFYEIYKTKNYSFKGNKELYIKAKNGKIKIFIEK
jgi:murein L,D-transpeptidase YafK